MTTFRLAKPLILSAFTLAAFACSNPSQNDDKALVDEDERRAPGNDGGVDNLDDSLRMEGGTTTDGTVNSYIGTADENEDVYQATVGGTDDNVNFNGEAINGKNDPLTPNAPLADGTAGQPDKVRSDRASVRDQNAAAIPGTGAKNGADRPYGNNEASPAANVENGVVTQEGLRDYVAADVATNMPVYAPGQDVNAYVGSVYGSNANSSSGPRTAPVAEGEDDNNRISIYAPAMSDVAAASYTNTQTKLFPKVGAQNFVTYQPMRLTFTPLLSWSSATTTNATAGAATPAKGNADKVKDSAPRLGSGCDNAADVEDCSSAAFDQEMSPILNDPRVSRSIAQDRIDAFRFELDALGKVDPRSIVVMTDGKPCTAGECSRFRSLLSGVLAQQQWTAASKDGTAVASRVMVPLRYGVGTNKNMLE